MKRIIQKLQKELNSKIAVLCNNKIRSIDALLGCDKFIHAATIEAAYGEQFHLFEGMRNAADLLPSEFENLDSENSLKSVDRRIGPYLRSQLFIALIAEMEVFFSEVLILSLQAYPQKIKEKNTDIDQILLTESLELLLLKKAQDEVNGLFYKGPKEIKRRIEEILSIEPSQLNDSWPLYIEMKARRDVAVHNGWKKNPVYINKIEQVGIKAPNNDFLGVSIDYFSNAIITSKKIVTLIEEHCNNKFSNRN